MANLEELLDQMVQTFANDLADPNKFYKDTRKLLQGSGITKDDLRDVLHEASTHFKDTCRQRMSKHMEACKIDEHLEDLKEMDEECQELNAELGVTAGYRPLGVEVDLLGVVSEVNTRYNELLRAEQRELDEQIAEAKAKLAKKNAAVVELGKQLEQKLRHQE